MSILTTRPEELSQKFSSYLFENSILSDRKVEIMSHIFNKYFEQEAAELTAEFRTSGADTPIAIYRENDLPRSVYVLMWEAHFIFQRIINNIPTH